MSSRSRTLRHFTRAAGVRLRIRPRVWRQIGRGYFNADAMLRPYLFMTNRGISLDDRWRWAETSFLLTPFVKDFQVLEEVSASCYGRARDNMGEEFT